MFLSVSQCLDTCSGPSHLVPTRGFLYQSFVQSDLFASYGLGLFIGRSVGEGGAVLYPGLGILLVALSKRMCRCWEDAPDFCSY